MQACQLVGQFKVSTKSRGNPNGKSNAPTQFLLAFNQALNPSKESICSIFDSTIRLLFDDPMEKTIDFFLLGLLEKSQPMTCVTFIFSSPQSQRHHTCGNGYSACNAQPTVALPQQLTAYQRCKQHTDFARWCNVADRC